MALPTPNTDESLVTTEPVNLGAPPQDQMNAPFIGNFHKTLPHNKYGEVDETAYRKFERTCIQIEAGMPINFEEVPKGSVSSPDQSSFENCADPKLTKSAAKFTSPMAGASSETHGPDPKSLEMLPAPGLPVDQHGSRDGRTLLDGLAARRAVARVPAKPHIA